MVVVNEYVRAFEEIGVIMLLFAAGVEMELTSLRKAGPPSLLTAPGGVLPLTAAYYGHAAMGDHQPC